MTFDCDLHMHTKASDGHCDVSALAKAARERGLKLICVTDHSFSSLFCHQTLAKFDAQRAEIEEESGINIVQGIEANMLGSDGAIDVPDEIIARCGVLIAGFHRFVALALKGEGKFLRVNGFYSERERQKLKDVNTEAYIRMIERYPIDIVAHIGHRCPVDFVKVAKACAAHDVYIEFNEKHIMDTVGFGENIDAILATGVKFTVGSDAHRADNVGRFDNVAAFIKKYEVPLERVYGANGNVPVFKDRSGWRG